MKRSFSIILCIVILLCTCSCTTGNNKTATDYDSLTVKLAQSVDSLFSKDFEKDLKEGKFLSPTGELNDKWTSMLKDAKADFYNIDQNAFGYKIIDLNSDSSPELLFMRSDDKVLAVFTMHEGKATLVDTFNRSYICVIRDTGELYTMTIRDDGGYDYRINTLNASTGTLVTTVSFGTEGSIAYESIQGSIYTTSSERITELINEYPYEMSEAFKSIKFNLF